MNCVNQQPPRACQFVEILLHSPTYLFKKICIMSFLMFIFALNLIININKFYIKIIILKLNVCHNQMKTLISLIFHLQIFTFIWNFLSFIIFTVLPLLNCRLFTLHHSFFFFQSTRTAIEMKTSRVCVLAGKRDFSRFTRKNFLFSRVRWWWWFCHRLQKKPTFHPLHNIYKFKVRRNFGFFTIHETINHTAHTIHSEWARSWDCEDEKKERKSHTRRFSAVFFHQREDFH